MNLRRRPYFFFFNDTATTEIYTLSLHDALPISLHGTRGVGARGRNVGRRPGRAGTPASCREPPTDGSKDVSTHLLRHRSVAELVKRRADPLPAAAFNVAARIVAAALARGEASPSECP